jgi:hypothetical protein
MPPEFRNLGELSDVIALSLGDSSQPITKTKVDELDLLCGECPSDNSGVHCPFKTLSGISRPSRRSLFSQMSMDQVRQLYELATDCTCLKVPRARVEIN